MYISFRSKELCAFITGRTQWELENDGISRQSGGCAIETGPPLKNKKTVSPLS
jgi:hypothetical protein